MIEQDPNLLHYWILSFIPVIIGIFLLFKLQDEYGLSAGFGGLGLFIFIVVFAVGPINDAYEKQINNLIDTTDCKTISILYDDYKTYRERIIDEIILRCLNDDPVLKDFVSEHKSEIEK